MRRSTRIATTILFAMSMLFGMAQNGFAQELDATGFKSQVGIVEDELVSAVTDKFSEYYSVDDVQLTLCGVHEEQTQTEYFYKVDLSVMLRYASVEEMDYFQGMIGAAGIKLEAAEAFSSLAGSADEIQEELRPYTTAVFSYLNEEYEKLDAYIGRQQIIPIYMKAVIDTEGYVELFMDAGEDYAPFDEFSLGTRDELKGRGALCMTEELAEVSTRGMMSAEENAARTNSEAQAVLYMITYTSNPTVCDYCGGVCKTIRDRSKWNNSVYPQDHGHADCADYISQALRAAGFADTEKWSYNTETWNRVSLLIPHMLSKGRIGIAPAGVIKVGYLASNGEHVMMVTAFDGVSYRYSAHTRDRKDAAVAPSGYTYYNVNYQ